MGGWGAGLGNGGAVYLEVCPTGMQEMDGFCKSHSSCTIFQPFVSELIVVGRVSVESRSEKLDNGHRPFLMKVSQKLGKVRFWEAS